MLSNWAISHPFRAICRKQATKAYRIGVDTIQELPQKSWNTINRRQKRSHINKSISSLSRVSVRLWPIALHLSTAVVVIAFKRFPQAAAYCSCLFAFMFPAHNACEQQHKENKKDANTNHTINVAFKLGPTACPLFPEQLPCSLAVDVLERCSVHFAQQSEINQLTMGARMEASKSNHT